MGGLVTSHGAGLAVPDWPNSFGYNMFLFPPNQWVGGILYEHTHRLMGTVVGFLSVGLVVRAYGPARRPGVRRWAGVMAAVCGALAVLSAGVLLDTRRYGVHAASSARRKRKRSWHSLWRRSCWRSSGGP